MSGTKSQFRQKKSNKKELKYMKLSKLEQILGFDQVWEKVAVMVASPLGANAMRELELIS